MEKPIIGLAKSLRFDKDDFFETWARCLISPEIYRDELRKPNRNLNTWSYRLPYGGDGHIEVVLNDSKDSNLGDNKKHFTRHQSMTAFSVNRAGKHVSKSRIFGWNKERGGNLTGVLFNAAGNTHAQRIMPYDGGTYERPYDYHSRDAAKAAVDYKLANHGLFENYEDLLAHQDQDTGDKQLYNEIMASLRLAKELDNKKPGIPDFAFCVFSDSRESRLLATLRRDRFFNMLQELKLGSHSELEDEYDIPIYIYGEKGITEYTHEEQKEDLREGLVEENTRSYVDAINFTSGTVPLKDINISVEFCELIAKTDYNKFKELFKSKDEVRNLYTSGEPLANLLYKAIKEGAIEDLKSHFTKNVININTDPALDLAVKQGDIEAVKFLLELGADINKAGEGGWTPLSLASYYGHLDVVNYLVEDKSAGIDKASKGGTTPLHIAAKNGHINIVKLLLSKGADINKTDNNGRTPLSFASKEGHIDVVRFLVGNGADINKTDNRDITPLHFASASGYLDVVKYLAEDAICDINKTDNTGASPLFFASAAGHLNVVKCLIEDKSADFNETDNYGRTPLSYACETGHLDVVKYLVEAKRADINKTDNIGWTPVHFAAACGHLDVVKYLVDQRADINQTDNTGAGPLCYASVTGHLDVVKYLVKDKSADINKTNNNGITPLSFASANGHLDVVKYLLNDESADISRGDAISECVINLVVKLMKSDSEAELIKIEKLIYSHLSELGGWKSVLFNICEKLGSGVESDNYVRGCKIKNKEVMEQLIDIAYRNNHTSPILKVLYKYKQTPLGYAYNDDIMSFSRKLLGGYDKKGIVNNSTLAYARNKLFSSRLSAALGALKVNGSYLPDREQKYRPRVYKEMMKMAATKKQFLLSKAERGYSTREEREDWLVTKGAKCILLLKILEEVALGSNDSNEINDTFKLILDQLDAVKVLSEADKSYILRILILEAAKLSRSSNTIKALNGYLSPSCNGSTNNLLKITRSLLKYGGENDDPAEVRELINKHAGFDCREATVWQRLMHSRSHNAIKGLGVVALSDNSAPGS